MNISSVVVITKPEKVKEVVKSLEESGLCEVYLYDEKGRIIVIIEAEETNEEAFKLRQIQLLPDVLTANMVYSYSEEEWEKAQQYLEQLSNEVPDMLNEENIRAENIVYKGHIKGYINWQKCKLIFFFIYIDKLQKCKNHRI